MTWGNAFWLLIGVAICLGGWTFRVEPSSVRVQRHDVPLPAWPKELDGIEIALSSDLNVGSPYYALDTIKDVVQLVNESKPDVILLAGDYVIDGVRGGTFVPPEDIATTDRKSYPAP